MPTQIGLVGDRYALDRVIGRGGVADVYRAHDSILGRAVAVKLMRSAAATEADRRRVVDEARTLASLSHPNLVTLLDAGFHDGCPYLVMELVDASTLGRIENLYSLDPADVARVGSQVAAALSYVHSRGVAHRDVKPANILVAGDGRVWLTDFGIAKLIGEVSTHTSTGMVVGTAAYMSPEQLQGHELTTATDIYSLGLVLLEALSRDALSRGTPTQIAAARLVASPTLPHGLPAGWADLLGSMTAVEPAARPTAAVVTESLTGLAVAAESDVAPTAVLTAAIPVLSPPGAAESPSPATVAPLPTEATASAVIQQPPSSARRMISAAVMALGAIVLVAAAAVLVAGLTTDSTPLSPPQPGPTAGADHSAPATPGSTGTPHQGGTNSGGHGQSEAHSNGKANGHGKEKAKHHGHGDGGD